MVLYKNFYARDYGQSDFGLASSAYIFIINLIKLLNWLFIHYKK